MSADEKPATETKTPPKRQARGQRRMEQILQAAATVFAERGYEATTTNAIASAAEISPGSLYQFFTSKEDIARSLAEHYVQQLAQTKSETFDDADATGMSPARVVDSVIDPVVAFNVANPGFKALFARTDMPASLAQAVAPIHAAIHGQVTRLILTTVPTLNQAQAEHATTVVVQLVRAMMPLITGSSGPVRRQYIADLKRLLVTYLT
ncbi:TetR family transcriptional regulator [Stackebrandtia endophytica]|uniref:TetR family transcriptional regulator n=1 Tax=Stackebrandtia endophytica TaxID=1496996 RepID=A0A543AZ14_9ACTN|nr:TetR/AcrR family transcriptional regulator [Stackebrandtia endophytica]TQL77817.1 TetR family transcriptional regulator [Stackebrandtia endophytica]